MRHRFVTRRRTRLGAPGYVALLVGLASAGLLATSGGRASNPPPPGASPPPPPSSPSPTFTPTERIDVEEAVSFPYDI